MAIDVFLSYAKEDLRRAALVAQALEREGLTVWWDRKTPPGKVWADVLEEALKQASTVVVLWSEASLASKWNPHYPDLLRLFIYITTSYCFLGVTRTWDSRDDRGCSETFSSTD